MCRLGRRSNACHPHWHAPPSQQHLQISCRPPSRRVGVEKKTQSVCTKTIKGAWFFKHQSKQERTTTSPGLPPQIRGVIVLYLQRYLGQPADPLTPMLHCGIPSGAGQSRYPSLISCSQMPADFHQLVGAERGDPRNHSISGKCLGKYAPRSRVLGDQPWLTSSRGCSIPPCWVPAATLAVTPPLASR